MKLVELSVTTNAGGAGTATGNVGTVSLSRPAYGAYTNVPHASLLYAVEWKPGTLSGTVDYSLYAFPRNGGTVTLLSRTDGSVPATYLPRTPEHDNAGTALSTYGMHFVEGTVQLVVSQGGSVGTGSAYLWLMDA